MDSRDVNEYSPPEELLGQCPDACAEIYAIGMIFWVGYPSGFPLYLLITFSHTLGALDRRNPFCKYH